MKNALAFALAYLRGESPFGRPVAALPCCAPDPTTLSGCTAPWHTADRYKGHKVGKVPLVGWKAYEDRLPTEAEWRGWDARFCGAGYSLGTLTGALSGVLLLDVDCHDPAADGRQTLRDRALAVPPGPAVPTPSGGMHVWFAYPTDAEPGSLRNFQARTDWPGIDARGDGGFAVLPPSAHASGGVYAWEPATKNLPLPDAPEWFLAAFVKREALRAQEAAADEWAPLWHGPWTPGQRHGAACRLIGHLREHGISESEAAAMLTAWDATACNPSKGADEIAAQVADLYGRSGVGDGMPPPAPWDEAWPAFLTLPASLQDRLRATGPDGGADGRRVAGALADALRMGADEAVALAWALDVFEGDKDDAHRAMRWAMRVSKEPRKGRTT